MEQIQIAVCDDDQQILDLIAGATKQVLGSMDAPCQVECYGCVAELKKRMGKKRFDLLLLDVDMPGEDGIHFGIELRKQDDCPDIIYISRCENRVYESFLASPIGFVRKHYFLSDMSNIMKLYLSILQKRTGRYMICLETKDGFVHVEAGDIMYVESWLNKQEVHLRGDRSNVVINSKMETLEQTLTSPKFLRIHKSFIVNFRYINRLTRECVELTDGTCLPIAQRRYKEVYSDYAKLIRSESAVVIEAK